MGDLLRKIVRTSFRLFRNISGLDAFGGLMDASLLQMDTSFLQCCTLLYISNGHFQQLYWRMGARRSSIQIFAFCVFYR